MNPLIGVNMHVAPEVRNRNDRIHLEWLCIEVAYVGCLTRAGAECVLLPASNEVPSILGQLAGLVMIGGGDYDPILQGYHRTSWTKRIVPYRQEEFDRLILQAAIDSQLPVLAIGAGMQLLNVLCGGTLAYEISKDFPHAMPHQDGDGTIVRHAVELTDVALDRDAPFVLSRAFSGRQTGYIEASERIVTSRHHQAIDDVASGFEVTLRARDGIVEGIENPDWPAVGVQFHPESPEANEIERGVFEAWLETVRELVPA